MIGVFRPVRTILPVTALVLLAAVAVVRGAEPELIVTPIARDGQLLVTFDLSDGLTSDVRDAIQSGLPTAFTYDIELRRAAAWFDRPIASLTLKASVRFDNLSRRYEMARTLNGRVEAPNSTEDEQAMRRWLTHVERLPIAQTATLEANGEYYVRVRVNARSRNRWFAWPWDRDSALGRATFTFLP